MKSDRYLVVAWERARAEGLSGPAAWVRAHEIEAAAARSRAILARHRRNAEIVVRGLAQLAGVNIDKPEPEPEPKSFAHRLGYWTAWAADEGLSIFIAAVLISTLCTWLWFPLSLLEAALGIIGGLAIQEFGKWLWRRRRGGLA